VATAAAAVDTAADAENTAAAAADTAAGVVPTADTAATNAGTAAATADTAAAASETAAAAAVDAAVIVTQLSSDPTADAIAAASAAQTEAGNAASYISAAAAAASAAETASADTVLAKNSALGTQTTASTAATNAQTAANTAASAADTAAAATTVAAATAASDAAAAASLAATTAAAPASGAATATADYATAATNAAATTATATATAATAAAAAQTAATAAAGYAAAAATAAALSGSTDALAAAAAAQTSADAAQASADTVAGHAATATAANTAAIAAKTAATDAATAASSAATTANNAATAAIDSAAAALASLAALAAGGPEPELITLAAGPIVAYAISRNGASIVYALSDQRFYISTNAGVTITQKTNVPFEVDRLVTSDDGNYIIAYNVLTTATSGNFAVISSNGGTTWNLIGGVNTRLRSAAMSSTGEIMFITSKAHGTSLTNGGAWRSTNFGGSWSQPTTSVAGWAQYGDGTCSMLPNGSQMVYCTRNGTGLFLSTDSGSFFTKLSIAAFQNFQGNQQTGCYIQVGFIVFASTTFVYSTDGGSSWTASSQLLASIPVNSFRGIASKPSSSPTELRYFKNSKITRTTDFGVNEELYTALFDVVVGGMLATSDDMTRTLALDTANSALVLLNMP
jgi:hypothetical protein